MKTFDYRKFVKKYVIRWMMKLLDLAILLSAGYALGLKLVRY